MPLGNSLPNAIWCLKQVPREFSKGMMISWDFGESGNACEVKFDNDECPTNERL